MAIKHAPKPHLPSAALRTTHTQRKAQGKKGNLAPRRGRRCKAMKIPTYRNKFRGKTTAAMPKWEWNGRHTPLGNASRKHNAHRDTAAWRYKSRLAKKQNSIGHQIRWRIQNPPSGERGSGNLWPDTMLHILCFSFELEARLRRKCREETAVLGESLPRTTCALVVGVLVLAGNLCSPSRQTKYFFFFLFILFRNSLL